MFLGGFEYFLGGLAPPAPPNCAYVPSTNEIFIFFVTCLCNKISISYTTVQQFFRLNYHVNFKQWCNYYLFSGKRGLFNVCMKLINYNIY
jgi:hypothetical protein